MDLSTYSVKKLVLVFLGANLGFGLYATLRDTRLEDVQVYHSTRLISSFAGWCGRLGIPHFMRATLFGYYCKVYNVRQEDMLRPLDDYTSFVDFFTRKVKERQVDPNPAVLVAPADSKVLAVTPVTGNDVLMVKNVKYPLGEFLTGSRKEVYTAADLAGIKKSPQDKQPTELWSAIFYLSPGDYHRYHSPVDFSVRQRRHVAGHLYPVKISYIEENPRVYADNERLGLFGEWKYGLMSQVYVGATNVGSMTVAHEPDLETNILSAVNRKKVEAKTYTKPVELKKGQEVGMFKLGSTVVMVFEAPKGIEWHVKEGDAVRYGQPIATVKVPQK